MHFFTKSLLQWHAENPRPLPWSNEKRDPYSIWLSEVIMQQTRIEQGASYYLRFIKKYPTVSDLANASHDEVMQSWEGLGYYTRARNLHKAAKYVTDVLDGIFPDSYEGLLALPGIGPYSAAAISSFAYGHRHAVVDGNVKRLISRYKGIAESIDEPSTHEKIRQVASDLMKQAPPDVFNQAIMNFGALICKPKPLCDKCPLATGCYAYKHNLSSSLPVRTKKKLNRIRYFHFIVIHYRGKILMQRREANDIWRGLYAPPVIEHTSERSPLKKHIASFIGNLAGHNHIEYISSTGTAKQILSHQTIHGSFHHISLLSPVKTNQPLSVWASENNLRKLAKPKLVGMGIDSYFKLSLVKF